MVDVVVVVGAVVDVVDDDVVGTTVVDVGAIVVDVVLDDGGSVT